jgi:hypothetical protein
MTSIKMFLLKHCKENCVLFFEGFFYSELTLLKGREQTLPKAIISPNSITSTLFESKLSTFNFERLTQVNWSRIQIIDPIESR